MFFTQLCCLLPAIPWALNDLQINQNTKPDSMPLLCTVQSACQTVQPWQRGFKESCLNILLPVNIRFSTNTKHGSPFQTGWERLPKEEKNSKKKQVRENKGWQSDFQLSALLPQAINKLIRSKPDLVLACITDRQWTLSAETDTENCSSIDFSGTNKILMAWNSPSSSIESTSKWSEHVREIATNLTLALKIQKHSYYKNNNLSILTQCQMLLVLLVFMAKLQEKFYSSRWRILRQTSPSAGAHSHSHTSLRTPERQCTTSVVWTSSSHASSSLGKRHHHPLKNHFLYKKLLL